MFMNSKSAVQVALLGVALMILWPLVPVALAVGVVWLAVKAARGARRHPVVAAGITTVGAALVVFGVDATIGLAIITAALTPPALLAARFVFPDQWRAIRDRRRRRRSHARQLAAWPAVAVSHGLGFEAAGKTVTGRSHVTKTVPALVDLDVGPWRHRYTLRPLPNQSLADYTARADALALHLGARGVRATLGPAGHVTLDVLHGDPLEQVVPPFRSLPAGAIDLAALRVGRLEDSGAFTVQAGDGAHLLIGGETKAGKSSIVWSIFAELGPLIAAGVVRLWGIDPKSQEVPFAPHLFHRSATGVDGARAMVELLEAAAEEMQATAAASAGLVRSHIPTPESPLNVVYVDELAWITAYQTDKKLRDRAVAAIAAIATQGRTVGFWLIGAAQSPKADVVAIRELFPVRIGLRLSEAAQVEMLLGKGARDLGARCDEIPRTLRGVGYARQEDGALARFRAAYLDDAAVQALEHAYAPPRRLTLVQGDDLEATA